MTMPAKVHLVSKKMLINYYLNNAIKYKVALIIHNPLLDDKKLCQMITDVATYLEIDLEAIPADVILTSKIIIPVESEDIAHIFCQMLKAHQNNLQVTCDIWLAKENKDDKA